MLQDGPAGDLVQAWEAERTDLLSRLEEAEERILQMSTQVGFVASPRTPFWNSFNVPA
jgi:hypothetical protein